MGLNKTIKLHEVTYENISAAREVIPDAIKLTTDINCNWSSADAKRLMPAMKEMNLYWVEEPLFPPDSEAELAKLQADYGVSIASGENACTSVEFSRLAPSIDFIQPSVIKVGGVTDCIKLTLIARSVSGRTFCENRPV